MKFIMKSKDIFFKIQKPKLYFLKTKTMKHESYEIFCVCVNELEQSTTNLSFIFYPKIKILNLQT